MFYRAISLTLVAVLADGIVASQDQPQSPPQTVANMQQVLHKAQEKDKSVRVILKGKIDNQKKFSGQVSDISDTGFAVTDAKTRKTQELTYAEVREVRQIGISKVTIIAVVFVAGIALIAWAAFVKAMR
jgi:1,4-dihydroxy-2-naphthoyl-CoA synthase